MVVCQPNGLMEHDSSYRLSRGMKLLDIFRHVLLLGRRELREAAVGELAVPVMQSRPEVTVEEVVERENNRGSVREDFFAFRGKSNVRVWCGSLCWRRPHHTGALNLFLPGGMVSGDD